MMRELVVTNPAVKKLARIPEKDRRRIEEASDFLFQGKY
jgi:hypothetical protein